MILEEAKGARYLCMQVAGCVLVVMATAFCSCTYDVLLS